MLFHVWRVQKNGIVVACGAAHPQGLIHPAFAGKLDHNLLCAKCHSTMISNDPVVMEKPQKLSIAAAAR